MAGTFPASDPPADMSPGSPGHAEPEEAPVGTATALASGAVPVKLPDGRSSSSTTATS